MPRTKIIPIGKLIISGFLPTLLLAYFRWLSGTSFHWISNLKIWLFICGVLYFASLFQPESTWVPQIGTQIAFHPASVLSLLFTISLGIIYWMTENTLIAWLLLSAFYILLLGWIKVLSVNMPIWRRLLLEAVFTLAAGLLPAIFVQIETRFSSEEFFVVIESLILMLFWLILRWIYVFFTHGSDVPIIKEAKWQIKRSKMLGILFLTAITGVLITVNKYQSSFFTDDAPGFPGISEHSPYLCSDVPAAQDTHSGSEVFQEYLKKIEEYPGKSSPELALLALGTGDLKWAREFHDSLLSEAEEAIFTEPAGSVKYGQYLASQRAYFYPLVREKFPETFSTADQVIIKDWFAAINKRALTVEWVDWMYALAFRYWPQGPYENQENGAGLLSLLEINKLSDFALSEKNQQYLADNPRGWLTNFRVTDDAAFYQPEWMGNAWFQSLYGNNLNNRNQQLAFDWLKILALPDGSPLRYNHIGALHYANHAYWGSFLMKDENLLWLAARALEYQQGNIVPLKAQPGSEQTVIMTGHSPTVGSCLVFGDSGLPTQLGPLAPDKIIFRSGWERDDIYILLNLRFSGWHRYKATNSLVQVYQNELLVVENDNGKSFEWLPTGRSLFRDKRIPRENLNGLIISKNGLSAVLYQLTGIDGPWSQDPPHYAQVPRFETGPDLTVSTSLINDWHGWKHQRTVYFYPQGVAVVLDKVQGDNDNPAALIWHFKGQQVPNENRILLGQTDEKKIPSEAVLIPISSSQPEYHILQPDQDAQQILQATYKPLVPSSMDTATIFLFSGWKGAQIYIQDQVLIIDHSTMKKEIPLTEGFYE